MWFLAGSFNKWMLCSKSLLELGPVASLLWGTCWKSPSRDLWGWGWRTSMFTVCYRVFAWNQPDWSSKQSSRPAVCFPACLCSREKQKEAKISRDALPGTFAIPLSRRAAEKILVRVLCLTSSFTCPGIDSRGLSTSASVFRSNSMGTGCAPLLSFLWAVSQGQVVFLFPQSDIYICCFSLIALHCHRASVPSWTSIECAE